MPILIPTNVLDTKIVRRKIFTIENDPFYQLSVKISYDLLV